MIEPEVSVVLAADVGVDDCVSVSCWCVAVSVSW